MTDAERELLRVALEFESRGTHRGSGPVADAAKAVLLERATPEAKEKFFFLYDRMKEAQRAFTAYTDTLPGPLVREWYPEYDR